MSYLTTSQKLKTILDTVSTSILPVTFLFTESMPSSFPVGVIHFAGSKEKMIDTQYNQIDARYVIRLIFATEESQTAMEKWMTLIDAVAAEFRKDDHQTLDGIAVGFMIDETTGAQISTDYSQPVLFFDMIVTAKFLKSITT